MHIELEQSEGKHFRHLMCHSRDFKKFTNFLKHFLTFVQFTRFSQLLDVFRCMRGRGGGVWQTTILVKAITGHIVCYLRVLDNTGFELIFFIPLNGRFLYSKYVFEMSKERHQNQRIFSVHSHHSRPIIQVHRTLSQNIVINLRQSTQDLLNRSQDVNSSKDLQLKYRQQVRMTSNRYRLNCFVLKKIRTQLLKTCEKKQQVLETSQYTRIIHT